MITFEKIRQLVDRSNPTIIEVGAHDGKDTQAFLDTFPFCTMVAFEPEPRAIRKFRDRVTSDRVRLVESAIGATSGTCTFYPSSGDLPNSNEAWAKDWDSSGSIKEPTRHLQVYPWVKYETKISVPVVRLDDWVAANGLKDIDFIWADVQGAEGDLIRGGTAALKQTRFFYTEFSNQGLYANQSNLNDIVAALPDFDVVEVFRDDVLLRNKAITM